MTTTTLSPVPVFKQFDNNGAPLASGKLFTYQGGTTTKLATYTDSTGGTPNTNPVILNARGEAQVWVPPNVAYKFVLAPSTDTDPPTSPIWTVDQIVNSQLITLYGGVDTGVTNAYVLNFTANFTSYTDGIIIYWIPSNTNGSASTINVNGLGVINVTNFDGSALIGGQIVANQPAEILIKGGAALLITPAIVQYGSFAPGWGGFSTPPAGNVLYRKTGSSLTFIFPSGTGVSNGTSFSMSGIPAAVKPGGTLNNLSAPMFGFVDNGANVASGMAIFNAGSLSMTFFKDGAQTLWTGSGNKGFQTGVQTTVTFPT